MIIQRSAVRIGCLVVLTVSTLVVACSRSIHIPFERSTTVDPAIIKMQVDPNDSFSSLLGDMRSARKSEFSEVFLLTCNDEIARFAVFHDLGMAGIHVREDGEIRDISPARTFLVTVLGEEWRYATHVDWCGVILKNSIEDTRPSSAAEILTLIRTTSLEREVKSKLVDLRVQGDIEVREIWHFLRDVSRITPYIRINEK